MPSGQGVVKQLPHISDHHWARWKPLLKLMLEREVGGYQIICAVISRGGVGRSHQEEFRERNKGKQHLGIAEGIIDTFCRRWTRILHTWRAFYSRRNAQPTPSVFHQALSEQRKESQIPETLMKPLVLCPGSMCKQCSHNIFHIQLKSPWLRSYKTQKSSYKIKQVFPPGCQKQYPCPGRWIVLIASRGPGESAVDNLQGLSPNRVLI